MSLASSDTINNSGYRLAAVGEDELKAFLQAVSDKGLKVLSLDELDRLRALLSIKDYGANKKADRSKKKLMKQINFEIYNRHNPRRFL